jgi:hypothetical protein
MLVNLGRRALVNLFPGLAIPVVTVSMLERVPVCDSLMSKVAVGGIRTVSIGLALRTRVAERIAAKIAVASAHAATSPAVGQRNR